MKCQKFDSDGERCKRDVINPINPLSDYGVPYDYGMYYMAILCGKCYYEIIKTVEMKIWGQE